MKETAIYCKGDNTYHYISELPKTLQPFATHQFSSGSYVGEDFKSFNRKFQATIKKRLPEGYLLHKWNSRHYYISGIIKAPGDQYIYFNISDVRFWPGEWYSNIMYRKMVDEKDLSGKGGSNRYTTLFSFTEDIAALGHKCSGSLVNSKEATK